MARLRRGAAVPGWKTRCLFYALRLVHKYVWPDTPDAAWWREQGWLDRGRPWRA